MLSAELIDWFKRNGAEEVDWFEEHPNELCLNLEGAGALVLAVYESAVFVYSGLGGYESYGFRLARPTIPLLEALKAQGGGD